MSQYDIYKRDYERAVISTGGRKQKKPRRSICLLLAWLGTLVYLGYMLYQFATDYTATSDVYEQIGILLGSSLMIPHLLCVLIGHVFNLLGWLLKSTSCALAGAVLYTVSILLMPLYFAFVIAQTLLSYVGYILMRHRQSPNN